MSRQGPTFLGGRELSNRRMNVKAYAIKISPISLVSVVWPHFCWKLVKQLAPNFFNGRPSFFHAIVYCFLLQRRISHCLRSIISASLEAFFFARKGIPFEINSSSPVSATLLKIPKPSAREGPVSFQGKKNGFWWFRTQRTWLWAFSVCFLSKLFFLYLQHSVSHACLSRSRHPCSYIKKNNFLQFVRFHARFQKTCRGCLLNFCLCFFHLEKENDNIHILHSKPTAAGCHYEERSSFLIFFSSNSHSFGGGSRKEWKYSCSPFFAPQQQTQCVPMLPKSSRLMIHGEWRKGFSSLRENTPLTGILRYLHQFALNQNG